jgi:hypothetical protein
LEGGGRIEVESSSGKKEREKEEGRRQEALLIKSFTSATSFGKKHCILSSSGTSS